MCLLPEFQDDIQLLNGEITAKQKSLYEVSYLTAMYVHLSQKCFHPQSTIYTMELHEGDNPFFSGYST